MDDTNVKDETGDKAAEQVKKEVEVAKAKAEKEARPAMFEKIGNWFIKNGFYLSKFIIAVLVVVCIGSPLAIKFNDALSTTGIEKFVSVTVKEEPRSQTKNAKDAPGVLREEIQPVNETARETSFASSVWIYGLRIFGLLAALGGVLWAVVALCRE